jgi:integrase
VRQRKTGRPVRFELTEQTRQAVDDYLKATGKVPGEFLFTSRRRVGEAMTRSYAKAAQRLLERYCSQATPPRDIIETGNDSWRFKNRA